MDADDGEILEEIVTTGARMRSSSRAKPVRRTSLALFDAPLRRITFSDRSLPAVVAGGFDYVYTAQTRVTVPTDGSKIRAPLSSDTLPVQVFYEAAPGLSETAYAKAEVENGGKRPILQGAVTIFVNGTFTGEGRLATTGPGGTLELPMGADEDIRLDRKVIPATETEGVFSKDDITTYRVMMEVANYKKRTVQVKLREPLPKSRNEDIEIALVKSTPPAPKPGRRGHPDLVARHSGGPGEEGGAGLQDRAAGGLEAVPAVGVRRCDIG